MRVVVIGTGYVGLTTATVLAYIGHSVTCLDTNAEKINRLKQGILPIHEPHLDEVFDQVRHKMCFTTDYAQADIPNTEVIIIAVGTPSLPDGDADLTYLTQAAESLAQNLGEAFTLIVNKSTVP
ncbi:MAG TPA: 3-hydroxyacyl-CoA dehydrogenase NAD-binding domain-containing protein, partial [Anaerolineaceae bacterium]|nr:3-hydroxyacyl-CoA dehydrogenase NAD-binding domain-containing protein [Anaerolineaceae bacterium]